VDVETPVDALHGRAGFLARGPDVEVHAEEVRRVVFRLQRGEPVVVDAVARPDELLVLLAEPGEFR